MSDPVPTPKKEEPSFLGVGLGSIITSATGLIGGFLGAGPWGIVGLIVTAIGSVFGVNFLIRSWNSKVDASDHVRAGADSGRTSVDLANQADRNNKAIQREIDKNPPTDGFPQK